MSEDVDVTTTEQVTDETVAQPDVHPHGSNGESPRTFTQDQVNELMAKRAAKQDRATEARVTAEWEAKLAEAKREEKPTPPPKPATEPATAQEALSAVDDLRKDLAFERMINGLTLTDEQKRLAREVQNEEAQKAMVTAFDAIAKQADGDSATDDDTGDENLYVAQGAASSQPADQIELDATKWSAELVAQKIANGTLIKDVEKFRHSLPGGGNRRFSKRPIAKPK